MSHTRIEIRLEPYDQRFDHVELADLERSIEALRKTLRHTGALEGAADTKWRVVDLSHSSPAAVAIEPDPPATVHQRDRGQEIVDRFFGYWRVFESGEPVPPDTTRELLEAFNELGKGVRKKRVRAVIRNGDRPTVEITEGVSETINAIVGQEEVYLGSLDGRLESVNIHSANRTFRIYPAAQPGYVDCIFPKELTKAAGEALGHEVRVHGELVYRWGDRFPSRINADKVDELPDEENLPTIMALEGVYPNISDGLSAEEFLRKLRHRDG